MPNSQYYRNSIQIDFVDPHSLWERKEDNLILVDDDQFLEVPFSETDFYPIPNPFK